MNVRLRLAEPNDIEALVRIWAQPAVSRWWPNEDLETVTKMVTDPDDDTTGFVIEIDGVVAGYLQVYEESDPDYRHAGIDLMLGLEHQGKGLGPKVIGEALRWIEGRGHHRVVIDPDAANTRAIRAYEKAGFRPVGIMRRGNYDHTLGEWTDGLLMDLLFAEMTGT